MHDWTSPIASRPSSVISVPSSRRCLFTGARLSTSRSLRRSHALIVALGFLTVLGKTGPSPSYMYSITDLQRASLFASTRSLMFRVPVVCCLLFVYVCIPHTFCCDPTESQLFYHRRLSMCRMLVPWFISHLLQQTLWLHFILRLSIISTSFTIRYHGKDRIDDLSWSSSISVSFCCMPQNHLNLCSSVINAQVLSDELSFATNIEIRFILRLRIISIIFIICYQQFEMCLWYVIFFSKYCIAFYTLESSQ